MTEKRKNTKEQENDKTTENVTHGIFNKTENGDTHATKFKHINKIMSKRIIIIITMIIMAIILACLILLKRNNVNKIGEIKLAQEEQELIDLEVQVKEETADGYKCLLIFTSNDENEKIKSIEYPKEGEKEPYKIVVENKEGKDKIQIDYQFEKSKKYSNFKVITTSNNILELTPSYKIIIKIGSETIREIEWIKGSNYPLNEIPERENYTFYGWGENENDYIATYTDEDKYYYKKDDTEVVIYAIMRQNIDISSNSLIRAVEENEQTCQANISINDEIYTSDFMVYNEDIILDGKTTINGAVLENNIYEFGNEYTDVARESRYAPNMVILKINGNLTINEGIKMTACKSKNGYGGPKGLFIYCTGKIINNGTVDMTARGAKAKGQNIYLWQNTDGNYEYVPKNGGLGGERHYTNGRTNGKSSEIARGTGRRRIRRDIYCSIKF